MGGLYKSLVAYDVGESDRVEGGRVGDANLKGGIKMMVVIMVNDYVDDYGL